jgi:O-antigen ligase
MRSRAPISETAIGRPGRARTAGHVAVTSRISTSRISAGGIWHRVRNAGMRAAGDPFRTTLFVLIVLSVSRIHQQFSALKVLRPALVLTGLAVVIAFAKPALLSKRGLLQTWPAKLIAGFAIVSCLSMLFGIAFGNSALFILTVYAKTIIFAYLIIVAMRTPRDLYGLVWTIVISTALLCWTSLFIFKVQHYAAGYDRLAGLDTYDANDLGLVLLVGFAFTLLAFQTAGMWGKGFCAVVLVGIGAAISKSGSRGALLGLVACGIAILLLGRISIVKRVAFIALTGTALSMFSPPGYWKQMSTLLNPKADYNWDAPNGRRQVMLRGITYFKQYPLFGLGINNFAKAECSISDRAIHHAANTALRCTPPHNAYLEAGSELGVGGLILWLLMIPGGAISLIRLDRRMPRAWEHGTAEQRFLFVAPSYLAIGFVGFSVGSFFLSFAWMDVTYVMVAAWAALLLAIQSVVTAQTPVQAGAPPAPVSRYRASVVQPAHSQHVARRIRS